VKSGIDKMTELPIRLPDVDEKGFTALRRRREEHHMSHHDAADRLGVSIATYYRYESGFHFNMKKANEIVRKQNKNLRAELTYARKHIKKMRVEKLNEGE